MIIQFTSNEHSVRFRWKFKFGSGDSSNSVWMAVQSDDVSVQFRWLSSSLQTAIHFHFRWQSKFRSDNNWIQSSCRGTIHTQRKTWYVSESWPEGWTVCYISLILFKRLWERPWTAEAEVMHSEPWTEGWTACCISLSLFKRSWEWFWTAEEETIHVEHWTEGWSAPTASELVQMPNCVFWERSLSTNCSVSKHPSLAPMATKLVRIRNQPAG